MKIFYLIFFFILGTVIGSFLCVVGLRLPKNIDFVKGKSRCDACGHELHFYELIPIFSYIFLRGRCLKCHKKIDSIIPISEILGGLLFSTAYYLFGFSYNLVIALLIAALFIIIVTTDVTYYIIPDEIIITFSILFLIVEFLSGGIKNVGMHLLTGILLFIIMYLIMLLGEKLFKKESLGGGDVKLLFLFGLVLAAECFNTAIEVLNNMIRMNAEEKYIAAGHSKDSAAGAVLILAIAAAIIGLMIFIPQILSVLGR